MGDPSQLQTLPPNREVELPTVEIENSNHSNTAYDRKDDVEGNEGIHTDPNQKEIDSAHLDNISEQANQHFTDPNSTAIK